MRAAITLLIVSTVIMALGAAAVTVYAIQLGTGEIPVWFGLFSILYGLVLVVRNSVLRSGLRATAGSGLHVERLIALSAIVPGLLLFEEFYGRGWRSSLRWLLRSYCILAVAMMSGVVRRSPLEWILFPGSALVITVPFLLVMGYFTGYHAPPSTNRHPLAGLVLVVYILDGPGGSDGGLAQLAGQGIEPYGFLALVVCLRMSPPNGYLQMTNNCSPLPMKCGRRQEFRRQFFPPNFLSWTTFGSPCDTHP